MQFLLQQMVVDEELICSQTKFGELGKAYYAPPFFQAEQKLAEQLRQLLRQPLAVEMAWVQRWIERFVEETGTRLEKGGPMLHSIAPMLATKF